MAFGLNKAQLIGRLGADAVINALTNGGRVANLSVATDESLHGQGQAGEPGGPDGMASRSSPFRTVMIDHAGEATRGRAGWSMSRASFRPGKWTEGGRRQTERYGDRDPARAGQPDPVP